MRLRLFFALFALFAVPAAAATVQQDFDAAQAKLDAQDFYGARNAFMTLLSRFPPDAKGAAVSVVRARLGNVLIALNDPDAAVPMLETALPGLKAATPAEAELRALATFDLGRAEEASGALNVAARQYRAALDLKAFPADSPTHIGMRASLARTLIWSDPAAARRLLDELLALPNAQLNGDSRALVMTLRGRVDLNNGDPAGARRWFNEAAAAAGGSETQKVSVADIRIRGDLALANHALGDSNAVAKGMHFAGASGDIPGLFSTVAAAPLPACTPLTGLTSDTVAVIEFGVGDDGRVTGVTPIYARRGGGMSKPAADDKGPEVLFVEAVRDWFWRSEDVRKLDGFWRQAVRVELRCLTQRPADDRILGSFGAEFGDWYDRLGVTSPPGWDGNDAQILPAINAELARREGAFGANSIQLLPLLGQLANNAAAKPEERIAAADRWEALFRQTAPPATMLLAVQLWKTMMVAETDRDNDSANRKAVRRLTALMEQAESEGTGESRAAIAIRLTLANFLAASGSNAKARPLYESVALAPDSIMPASDPIRLQALLKTADFAARRGNIEAATNAIAATGLAPEQCSMIDVRPQKINGSVSQESFPAMAKAWGNSGYVKTGFDISTDGQPQNVRTVVSSPPFIFGPETEKAIAKFRYSPVFRPGNTVGCAAQTQVVRFLYAGY